MQICVAGDPSMRKSSLKDYGSTDLLPEMAYRNHAIRRRDFHWRRVESRADPFLKLQPRRNGERCSATMCALGLGSASGGLHSSSRGKLCAWVNGVTDVVVPGVYGQIVLVDSMLNM